MEQVIECDHELSERLASDLRQEEDELVLYAQSIAALSPGEAERPFQEILIRFQVEEKRLPPGGSFPILEECSLMHYVDRWVASHVARGARSVLAIKPDWPVPHEGINLSAATLTDRTLSDYTRKHLQIAGLPKGTLSFEITCESAREQLKPLLKLVGQLGQLGCGFILAGFVGGEGAFELMRFLAPEFVKLSPGLVRTLGQGRTGAYHFHAINGACHALGIKTNAEHVESDQTMAQLRSMGVDFGQGFAIEAPGPLI